MEKNKTQDKQETKSKVVDLKATVSIITFNLNKLHIAVKTKTQIDIYYL